MSSRISRDGMFMLMALAASYRGTCSRLQVGAVIVKDNHVVSMGYNGSPPGAPHCHHSRIDEACLESVPTDIYTILLVGSF